MNNNRNLRNFLIGTLSIFIVGLGCFGVGKAMGGEVSHPFKTNNYLNGFHFGNGNITWTTGDYASDWNVYQNLDLSNVKQIHFASNCGTISIDGNRDESNLSYANIRTEEFSVKLENGILIIDSTKKTCPAVNNHSPEFELNLKKANVMDEIEVSTNLGEVNISNMDSKVFDIYTALGSIDMEDIVSDKLTCVADLGEIEIDGDLKNMSEINASLGSISLEIKQDLSDYYYEIRTSLGSTYINGNESGGINSSMTGGDKTNSNHLIVNADLGEVNIESNQDQRD